MPPLVKTLFAHWLDYAGRFPPAGAPLPAVVERFHAALRPETSWFLHRLVLTPDDWYALASILQPNAPHPDPIPVSLVVGSTWDAIDACTTSGWDAPGSRCVAIEGRWVDGIDWQRVARQCQPRPVYVELPHDALEPDRFDRLREAGLSAKLRCGGTRVEQFPSSETVVRFLAECRRRELSFKLTAGLHHLDPGTYRLTYEPDSPVGAMHGFLAVALAALTLWDDPERTEEAQRAMRDARAADVRVESNQIAWEGRMWDEAACVRLRQLFHGVGSCSFDEPYEELAAWQT